MRQLVVGHFLQNLLTQVFQNCMHGRSRGFKRVNAE